jgi:uncharacterized SAM-binding protein YcdF (DUF218 family)
MKVSGRRWKYILIGSIGTLILQVMSSLLFLLYIGDHLVVEAEVKSADAIIVLGGDSCDFHRTRLAIELYNKGYAPHVIISSNASTLEEQSKTAKRWGLPDSCRTVILNCESTFDESLKIAPIAQHYNWKSLLLVTDRYHTLRARNVCRKQLPDIQVNAVGAYNSTYDTERYWRKEGSLDAVFHETIKLFFYWYYYGIDL